MKLVCFGLLLVVCQPMQEAVPSRVTVAVCPVTASWSADYQKRLAAELRALAARQRHRNGDGRSAQPARSGARLRGNQSLRMLWKVSAA
jgi:hypothetical protein